MPHMPKAKPKKWIYRKPKQKQSGNDTRRQRDERDKFYNTTQWRKLRALHLKRNPLCKWCEELGVVKVGKIVDHIKRIKSGGAPLDISNLQTLCTKCHAIKSGYEAHEKKNGNKHKN